MGQAALTPESLKMAIARRQPGPGVIHHPDQGIQYASGEYVDELKRHGFFTNNFLRELAHELDQALSK